MPFVAKARSFFRNLFATRRVESDLDQEVQSYLELLIQEKVRSGLAAQEAERAARVELGGVEQVKEEVRDQRAAHWFYSVYSDCRYGLRQLGKNPGFTTVAVLTLALGIGANTAIFSVINSVLLRALPYQEPNRLVMVWENSSQHPNPYNTVSPPNFLDWKSRNTVFSSMACIFDERDNLTGKGDPEEVVVQDVSTNFFSMLGVNLILGSGFSAENGVSGHDNVVVLSYGLWKDRFAGDSAIIGKSINLNGHPQTVVGVAPRDFQWFIKAGSLTGAKPQMWTPFAFPQSFHDHKKIGRFMTVVARLKPDATATQAQNEMNAIASQLEAEYPESDGHWGVNVVPLQQQLSGDIRLALVVLFGAVAFVLLIACANVAGLLLARAASREREMAIRTAIGASRWRIARQLLAESMLLAAIGGGIGVALAFWGTNVLLAASPTNLLELHSLSLDLRVLSFAVASTVFAGLLFGFLPSYISAHSRTSEMLKEGGRGSTSAHRRTIARHAFVVAQLGLALVLLAGSGLLVRSFIRLIGVDPGFETGNLLTFKIALPNSKYGTDPLRVAFFQQLLAKIAIVPGVRSASMESCPPLTGLGSATAVHVLSQPLLSLSELPVANVRVVGADYFSTMNIPLRAGRFFTAQELAEEKHVAIVNHAFVSKYLPNADPLGQKAVIYMKSLTENGNQPSEIVGVVGDVHQTGLDSAPEPTVYWPHPELVMSAMTILVRTSGDPLALLSSLRFELRQLDPELPMASVATMDQHLADSLARSRFIMLLLTIFSSLALLLAAVGIYGLIAYGVTQRIQELGIRIAVGADRRDVLRLVLGEGAKLTLFGGGLGLIAALALSRLVATFLFGVSPVDPITFAAVAGLLAVVALTACYIPARRATKVDPLIALRYQ